MIDDQLTPYYATYSVAMGISAFLLLDVHEILLAGAAFIHFFYGLQLVRPGWFTKLVRGIATE